MQATDQAELDNLLDTARITRVFNRYFRALDDKQFDEPHFRQIFTPDGKTIRPNGIATIGPANIANSHAESCTRFEGSQHLPTGHDVTIDGETTTVRANLVAIHLWKDRSADAAMLERSLIAGGVGTADLRDTSDGWRIAEIANHILWRTGDFGNMAQTR
ncbi:nuclear transport factor 2 family protein [Nocardia sp. NPDC046473]|uniref:nuclear transport factor 2 family protein n=1 Tax=Nocardia sp. NPDC046473 TaxID=3155733 RepID=UPI0033F7FADD